MEVDGIFFGSWTNDSDVVFIILHTTIYNTFFTATNWSSCLSHFCFLLLYTYPLKLSEKGLFPFPIYARMLQRINMKKGTKYSFYKFNILSCMHNQMQEYGRFRADFMPNVVTKVKMDKNGPKQMLTRSLRENSSKIQI